MVDATPDLALMFEIKSLNAIAVVLLWCQWICCIDAAQIQIKRGHDFDELSLFIVAVSVLPKVM
jgi:hypothetical protein